MNEYPDAGIPGKAQPEVVEAVERFRTLPARVRARLPLVYWLLGDGTPPYKMSKDDSAYGAPPPQAKGQVCGNCRFAYVRILTGDIICSQIEGRVGWGAWCRLWAGAGGKPIRDKSWRNTLKTLLAIPWDR